MNEQAGNGNREGLDAKSKELLTRLQSHIPLTPRPFLEIGAELSLSESETIERVRALSDQRLIRQISGIFDGASLGYKSSLVAARYAPQSVQTAARIISAHPGVSHNYQRGHEFNLWYTIAVPPGQDLEAEVDALHRLTGAEATRLLPALRLFKLGVRLEMDESQRPARILERASAATAGARAAGPPSAEDIRVVRALQDPLPVTERPFDRLAESHGFPGAEALLAAGERLHERGVLRRFSAVLRHRLAGFNANGMVVWKASPEECAAAGPIMARFAAVSHCYERPDYSDWPYRLYTMIHGRTPGDVDECIAAIRRETGLDEHSTLYSEAEFKKARVRYFTEDWERWEEESRHWEQALAARPGANGDRRAAADGGRQTQTLWQRRNDRLRIWGHLQSLQACLWDITSSHRDDLDSVREAAKLHAGEGMLLSTCQRLEAYSLSGCNCGAPVRLHGLEALLHLSEVAGGLHSVVLGEEQIAGQVRTALAESPAGVRELGDIALAAAREIRREASFMSHAGHLLDRGLTAAGREPAGHLLVIGTGHMGRLIARRGHELGFQSITVAGRRHPDSPWMEEIGAEFVQLADLPGSDPVDVAVGCLGSEAEELDPRADLPVVSGLVLDLGTPRNFADNADVALLAIEDLSRVDIGTGHRADLVAELSGKLRERLEKRLQMVAADSRSTVGAVRLALEKKRQAEVDRIVKMHPDLTRDLMDTITKSLVNRLFHRFSAGLKQIDDVDFHEQILALFTEPAEESREAVGASAR